MFDSYVSQLVLTREYDAAADLAGAGAIPDGCGAPRDGSHNFQQSRLSPTYLLQFIKQMFPVQSFQQSPAAIPRKYHSGRFNYVMFMSHF